MQLILTQAGRGLALMLVLLLVATQTARAQFPTQQTAEPDPESVAQKLLLTAHSVFVTMDGTDNHFPRSPLESEEAFRKSLQSWGRYTLASDAQHADVVLRLHPAVHVSVIDSTDNSGSSISYAPYFRLTVAEPATLKPLWSLTVPVQTGTRKSDHADRFLLSAQNLTSELKLLLGQQLTPVELADRNEVQRPHHSKLVWILPAVLVGAGVGGGLALRAKYNSDVQKQHDNLCRQNAFFCTNAVGGAGVR